MLGDLFDDVADGIGAEFSETLLDGIIESPASGPSPANLHARRSRARFWSGLLLFPTTGMAYAVATGFTRESDSPIPRCVLTLGFALASAFFVLALLNAVRAIGPARPGRWKLFHSTADVITPMPTGRALIAFIAAALASALTISIAR